MILGNTNSLVDNIYYLLWLKDTGIKEDQFNIQIPDTVLFKGQVIVNWYFSNKEGVILMKKDYHLNFQHIFEKFTQHVSKSGIVASFIYSKDDRQEKGQDIKYDDIIKPNEHQKIIIDYLTVQKLQKFLFTDTYEKPIQGGILQRFVDPYGDHNTVIQAIWSPNICVFNKRMNHRNLYDQGYDCYERAVTFDGAEVYGRSVPIRGHEISVEMRKYCDNVVRRISHVTFERLMISRMVAYFKPDRNNKLFFLYCSSIRMNEEHIDPKLKQQLHKVRNTPLVIDSNFIKPQYIKCTYTTNTMRPVKLENNMRCIYCQNFIQKTDLVPVPYKFIIKTFENQITVQRNTNIEVLEPPTKNIKNRIQSANPANREFIKDSISEVPVLIQKIYPKMTIEMYKFLSHHNHFLNKQILLCQVCYLQFTKAIPNSGVISNGATNLNFMKKGITKKKTMFTSELREIIAQKNLELAQENIVHYQRPETFERMVELLHDENVRKQRERAPQENQSSQLQLLTSKSSANIKNRVDRNQQEMQQQTLSQQKIHKSSEDSQEEGDDDDDENNQACQQNQINDNEEINRKKLSIQNIANPYRPGRMIKTPNSAVDLKKNAQLSTFLRPKTSMTNTSIYSEKINKIKQIMKGQKSVILQPSMCLEQGEYQGNDEEEDVKEDLLEDEYFDQDKDFYMHYFPHQQQHTNSSTCTNSNNQNTQSNNKSLQNLYYNRNMSAQTNSTSDSNKLILSRPISTKNTYAKSQQLFKAGRANSVSRAPYLNNNNNESLI